MEMEEAQGGAQASASAEDATTATTGTNNVLQEEIDWMQRDFMMRSNNGMNNQHVQFGGANDMRLHAMQSQMGYPQQAAAHEGGQPQEQQQEQEQQIKQEQQEQ